MNIFDNSHFPRSVKRPKSCTLRRSTGQAFTAAAFVAVAILLTASQASGQTLTAWVSPRLNRVGPTDAPGTTTSITLSSGRGETIATQVIVQAPAGGLSNVNLSVSALTGPNGATIAASNITLYREFYVSVNVTTNYGGGSNPPPQTSGTGTYPEPLIPFNDPEPPGLPLCGNGAELQACNASVVAGQNQPYWIDIFVPRGATNAPRGTYTGSVSVTADQGSATIPVTLTVWNFELPLQPSELSLWSLFPPASPSTVHTLAEALMRNKVMYWSDDPSKPDPSKPSYAASDITSFGLNRSGLEFYWNFTIPCSETSQKSPANPGTSQITSWAGTYPAELPLDIYVSDEWRESGSCTDAAYQDVATTATNAHGANPAVKTIMTAFTPDPDPRLNGLIDHWVLLDSVGPWPTSWNGPGDLWSYTSCNTWSGDTPEWMTDYPPINERIQAGFLNWTEGASGILYYRVDGWNAGNTLASWNNLNVTACFGNSRPGDGMFLYPPAPIGSTEEAPGIRLKAIRDGVQDYEYAHILHTMGQDAFVGSTLQTLVGNSCPSFSWTCWTKDPNAVENARQSLGQKLDQLNP